MDNKILQFINRIELEIFDRIEERFILIKNESIEQLKNFPDTNKSIIRLINELSFYFYRLIEILIEYSYYLQQSTNNLEKLLLSYIDLLNEFAQQRCHLSSNLIPEFDKKIYNKLSYMANEISNILTEQHH
jgi:hypothetical protein